MIISHYIPHTIFWGWVALSLLIGHLINLKVYRSQRITPTLSDLPPIIQFEGVDFVPQILVNHPYDVRLCYSIESVSKKSPHYLRYKNSLCFYNKFNNRNCDYLYLVEGITDDEKMITAIKNCQKFISKNSNLWE
jgi:hypothetical protein